MRHASILDVLGAVRLVARTHHEVQAWWYAPRSQLSLAGGPSHPPEESIPELAILAEAGAEVDEGLLARELGELLGVPTVNVRRHRGADEPRALFRLVTNTTWSTSPGRSAEKEEGS